MIQHMPFQVFKYTCRGNLSWAFKSFGQNVQILLLDCFSFTFKQSLL